MLSVVSTCQIICNNLHGKVVACCDRCGNLTLLLTRFVHDHVGLSLDTLLRYLDLEVVPRKQKR